MAGQDLFHGFYWALTVWFASAAGEVLPARAARMLSSVVFFALFAAFVGILVVVAGGLRRLAEGEGQGPALRPALVRTGCALVAAALLFAITRSPPRAVYGLISRWDHLAFCALAGVALHGARLQLRQAVLAALGLHFLVLTGDAVALACTLAACFASYGLSRLPLAGAPHVALQVVVLAGAYALAFAVQPFDSGLALQFQGLYCWAWMRQVSFLVESRRGYPATPSGYLCYMLFYPSFAGAVEVYNEFSERNYAAAPRPDYRKAAVLLLLGQLYTPIALHMQTTSAAIFTSPSTPLLWWNVMLVFVRSGLFAMGLWSTIEGAALLYGVQLRPNYPGVIWCQNPAQFWRSWRATMTNWLIRYVYVPLGGNRHHQLRNIAAAFAVSTAWHLVSIPFLRLHVPPLNYVPILLWGAVNALGVMGYILWRRAGRDILPAGTPAWLRAAPKVALSGVYGSFTITLLGFDPDNIRSFGWFCRTLLGL